MTASSDLKRYNANLQKEIDGAFQYRALAAAEKNPKLAEVYEKLAQSEEKHAAVWKQKLTEAGAPIPPPRPSWRARALGQLTRWFGAKLVLQTIFGN
jgi:rubrerythrin